MNVKKIIIIKDWAEIIYNEYLTEKAQKKFKSIHPGPYPDNPFIKVQLVVELQEPENECKKS